MRLSRTFCIGLCALLICVHYVCATVLTATMLTSFMGGFLMGKMTLGGFLMIMQGLNNGRQPTIAATNPAVPREGSVAALGKASEIENEIRDSFLKQLGEMDPLNCLPKVFCELSAPPKVEEPLEEENEDDERNNDREAENSEEDENSDSDEGGDERESPDEYDDLHYRLETRKKKQNLKLESDALDALVEESQDPMDYYFILKDKMKLRTKYNPQTASHPPFFPKKTSFMKKHGHPTYSDQSEYKATQEGKSHNKDIDDIFADDPFFDDFARSMKFSPETVDYHRVGRQLRRLETKTGDFSQKFRVAETVGQKSAKSCQHVFNTCPFEATQIMTMVNTLKRKNNGEYIPQPSESTTQATPAEITNNVEKLTTFEQRHANLQNLRNTLLAIESLNNVTLLANSAGVPVSYSQILAEVSENDVTGMSTRILDEFDRQTSNITITPAEETVTKVSKEFNESTTQKSSKKRKTGGGKTRTKKNKSRRQSKYRIYRSNRKTSRISKRSLQFTSRNTRSSESSSSQESPEMAELEIPPVLKLEIPAVSIITTTKATEVDVASETPIMVAGPLDNGRHYYSQAEFEDDEAIASEEENLFIPEFSKFTSFKKRPTPRPQSPVFGSHSEEGFSQNRVPITQRPSRPSLHNPTPDTNYNSESVLFNMNMQQPPPAPPRKKFTPHPVEDDEADASEADRAVEKIIAAKHQIKWRPFYRSSKESISPLNATVIT